MVLVGLGEEGTLSTRTSYLPGSMLGAFQDFYLLNHITSC